MINYKDFVMKLNEGSFADLGPKKGEWLTIPLNKFDPTSELNKELFDLISKSYQYVGGHVNYKSPADLPLGKDKDDPAVIVWYGLDFDEDPEADVVQFAKKTKFGTKTIGGATDGSLEAKTRYVVSTIDKLNSPGNYGEMSGAIAHILISRHNVPSINSQDSVEKILGKKVVWVGAHPDGKYPDHPGWYSRSIGGEQHLKILLGSPLNYK